MPPDALCPDIEVRRHASPSSMPARIRGRYSWAWRGEIGVDRADLRPRHGDDRRADRGHEVGSRSASPALLALPACAGPVQMGARLRRGAVEERLADQTERGGRARRPASDRGTSGAARRRPGIPGIVARHGRRSPARRPRPSARRRQRGRGPRQGHDPAPAHPAIGRLEPDHPAERRGAEHRADRLGTEGRRDHPRGHRRRRARRRSARRPAGIPGVPVTAGSLNANSVVWHLPRITAPAARSRATQAASSAGTTSAKPRAPEVVGSPPRG